MVEFRNEQNCSQLTNFGFGLYRSNPSKFGIKMKPWIFSLKWGQNCADWTDITQTRNWSLLWTILFISTISRIRVIRSNPGKFRIIMKHWIFSLKWDWNRADLCRTLPTAAPEKFWILEATAAFAAATKWRERKEREHLSLVIEIFFSNTTHWNKYTNKDKKQPFVNQHRLACWHLNFKRFSFLAPFFIFR